MRGLVILSLTAAWVTMAINFPYEANQLGEVDARIPSLAFGNASTVPSVYNGPKCKVGPADSAWPSDADWAAFNQSLSGKLLKPLPPGIVCYPGAHYDKAKCDFALAQGPTNRFYLDDPVNAITAWAEGDTCDAGAAALKFNCTQGGRPVYVVNATTVKDVQMAVNFARNNYLRLNIRNTGHDFLGRSSGYGSLSVWVHHMKRIEYLKDYSMGDWKGPAAKISAGTEAFEAYRAMIDGNYTLVLTGAPTVSVVGGWAQGGGHSTLSSLYGLGADQLLSVNVVMADGRFVTADLTQNKELFWALRGGSPGTFGVVTSAIVKAYPPALNFSGSSFSLSTGPADPGSLTTLSPIKINPNTPNTRVANVETFWQAFNLYFSQVPKITSLGGMGFADLANIANSSYTLTVGFVLPGKTAAEATAFTQPIYASLRSLGLNISDPPTQTIPYANPAYNGSDSSSKSNRFFSSRLVPRANWADPALFKKTVAAIRSAVVDGGLTYRCRNFGPSLKAGGYLADFAGVNPAFRESLMHATVQIPQSMDRTTTTPAQFRERVAVLERHMDAIRALTPGSGAYINEAEVTEPGWQKCFFGGNYERLLAVKKTVDPWGLFWAPATVGSEPWAVRSVDGLPTQNGPLCRVES